MTTITSPHNSGLAEVRRLHRRRERMRSGRFVAEGEDLIAVAAQAGLEPLAGYRTPAAPLAPRGFQVVEPSLLAAVSTLGSGTRALAVYEQRWAPAPLGPLCLYLHAVRDPGNVGAVLRSAVAFGADSVAIGPDCADPYSPKAVRASMGAIFAVRLARAAGPQELPGRRIALVAHRGEWLQGPAREPLTLLLGGERSGLPQEVERAAEQLAHIPIASDSLNAAMAATIALYEMTRAPVRKSPR